MKKMMNSWVLAGMLTALAGFMGWTLAGCQQCMECRVYDRQGQLVSTQQEQCGTSSELQAYEQDCKDTYASVGYSCQCTYQ